NAPEPTLTSRTKPELPSAILLDMIDETMSGMRSTVEVMSRWEQYFFSASARTGPAAQLTAPLSSSSPRTAAASRPARPPGMAAPAAGQLRDGDVEDRDQRGQGQGDLVPDSPGRMLVRGGPGQ